MTSTRIASAGSNLTICRQYHLVGQLIVQLQGYKLKSLRPARNHYHRQVLAIVTNVPNGADRVPLELGPQLLLGQQLFRPCASGSSTIGRPNARFVLLLCKPIFLIRLRHQDGVGSKYFAGLYLCAKRDPPLEWFEGRCRKCWPIHQWSVDGCGIAKDNIHAATNPAVSCTRGVMSGIVILHCHTKLYIRRDHRLVNTTVPSCCSKYVHGRCMVHNGKQGST
ncbi:hypothetical protein BDR05DRAFT_338999 [Suillus weaverae]|nr:hypothetical protein BDR05DRAFT_338999 [Suillus weaverae]